MEELTVTVSSETPTDPPKYIVRPRGYISQLVISGARGFRMTIHDIYFDTIPSDDHTVDFKAHMRAVHQAELAIHKGKKHVTSMDSIDVLFMMVNGCQTFGSGDFPQSPSTPEWQYVDFNHLTTVEFEPTMWSKPNAVLKVWQCEYQADTTPSHNVNYPPTCGYESDE